jgi:hypothetical protein
LKVNFSASIVWEVGVGDIVLHEAHFSQEYGQQRVQGITLAKVSSVRKGNENRRVKVDFLPVLCQFMWGVGVGDILIHEAHFSQEYDNSASRASILQRLAQRESRVEDPYSFDPDLDPAF